MVFPLPSSCPPSCHICCLPPTSNTGKYFWSLLLEGILCMRKVTQLPFLQFISYDVHTGPVLDCSSTRLFKFGRNMATKPGGLSSGNANRCLFRGPLSDESRRFLISLGKSQRKIPENPYKILDINLMQDDFYVNLVDWSAQNILAVGLDSTVSLLKGDNEQVKSLFSILLSKSNLETELFEYVDTSYFA